MAVSTHYLTYVLEQLAGLAGVHTRRMFGGVGFYCDEVFFGLIADDVLYLRVGDSSRGNYTSRGMAQFRPYAHRPHLSMKYYEVPVEVIDDPQELVNWARRAVEVASTAPSKPRRGTSTGSPKRGRLTLGARGIRTK